MLTKVLEEIKTTYENRLLLERILHHEQGLSCEDGELTYYQVQGAAFQGLARLIYDEFTSVNQAVQVVDVKIGNVVSDDVVPSAHAQFWLKVTTKDHGWLHVYLNKKTQTVEWY